MQVSEDVAKLVLAEVTEALAAKAEARKASRRDDSRDRAPERGDKDKDNKDKDKDKERHKDKDKDKKRHKKEHKGDKDERREHKSKRCGTGPHLPARQADAGGAARGVQCGMWDCQRTGQLLLRKPSYLQSPPQHRSRSWAPVYGHSAGS